MTELMLILLGFTLIILGSWLFIFFPAGGFFVIVLGLICLGRGCRGLQRKKGGPTVKLKREDREFPETEGHKDITTQGCLIPVLIIIALFIALAIYNNR